ncbi:MAG: tRNA (adenosine(37)-N6)-dimethylallyltransferase MiaA [Paludibacteraceae bacterium]|nr:tRNA (adenosine(37)-N6)-dimethylallyltransferase MiaA [Paludibacteraceae bacterium]
MQKTLFILLGPTGVGKTDLSIQIAKNLNTEIVSCDSRQFFKEMPIGTAAPTKEQLEMVKHHFIGNLSIFDYYSCGKFEMDALNKFDELFNNHNEIVMTGGSMLYIDAVCKGIDDLPDVDQELRDSLNARYAHEGIEGIRAELKILDPEYYQKIDPKNYKRIIHAVEICLTAGKPYSEIRKENNKERNFDIVKIGLRRDRDELYDRINKRVEIMIQDGLEEEARALYPHKELNALNTVGYKEMFTYFDGEWTLDRAIEMIQQNSRHYAKKQMSWFNRDQEISWFHPSQEKEIMNFIKEKLHK